MTGEDEKTSGIEKFDGTDFGYWKMQIEDYVWYKFATGAHNQALHGKNLLLSTYEKEMLAFVMVVREWHPYLQKWLYKLMDFDFSIEYKWSCDNRVADALPQQNEGSNEVTDDNEIENTTVLMAITMPIPNWLDAVRTEQSTNDLVMDLLHKVRNIKGRLETFETHFRSLFDTPTSSPTSSIMAKERGAQPKASRMTMYQLLHPTQSSIPSCIMFPPNAPYVEIKQGLMTILPDFRGLENENPYVHVRAFEEVIGSFYAQNVIETAKLRFFPFSLKDKAKGLQPRDHQFIQVACGGKFLQKEPEDAMDYLDEIAENSNTWNGPSPLDSTDRNRSSTTTSGGSVFKLREEDNMNAKISLLTKEIEALKLKGSRGVNAVYREDPMEACQICQEIDHTTSTCKSLSQFLNVPEEQKQGEQNQRFETMFTRIDEEMRETKSQTSLRKSITILRSGKEIGKDTPKANEKSKETPSKKDDSGIAKSNDIEKCPFPAPFPQALKLLKNLDVTSEILEHLHQVKVNLPLLHLIKQMPLYAKPDKTYAAKQSVGESHGKQYPQRGRPFLATANTLINCRNGRMITFGSMTAELNIFNVNPQQLVDEECEYVNFIEAAPQEEFNKNCFSNPFETLLVDSIVSNELKPVAKLFDSSLLDSLQILEEEQVIEAKNPPRSKKKSLLAYSDAPKLRLKKTPKGLPLASIEPHATSAVEVPSKESVDQEVEKAGEKTKTFKRNKTKRKALQDTKLSKKLLNSSKGVALHVARMKSVRGSNYSFGGFRSGR
uniref:Retrotransposon gag domain-containing protein n=1 Tax=Fagus sylvatica TaxID=28930 RepID=A0A2N9H6J4_FAGSY